MTSATASPKSNLFEPTRVIVIALYLYYAADVGRTLVWFMNQPRRMWQFPWVMGFAVVFVALYTLILWRGGVGRQRADFPRFLLHAYFLVQSGLVLAILILVHELDFVTGFYLLLAGQVALHTRGKIRLVWILFLLVLTGGHVLLFENPLRNIALQLATMAGIIVLAAYVVVVQEEEAARAQSQAMLAELQATHQKLELYASQAEDLAAIEERNRLARELHDSVSQILFSIILNVRAAQLLMEKEPARLRPQLQTLQGLAQSALAEMRGLIAQWRPK